MRFLSMAMPLQLDAEKNCPVERLRDLNWDPVVPMGEALRSVPPLSVSLLTIGALLRPDSAGALSGARSRAESSEGGGWPGMRDEIEILWHRWGSPHVEFRVFLRTLTLEFWSSGKTEHGMPTCSCIDLWCFYRLKMLGVVDSCIL